MFPPMSIPNVKKVYMYPKPVPMNWGDKKFCQLASEEMGIEPTVGKVFLFYNRKKDQLKIFFRDTDGAQILHKWLPNNTFLLPAPEQDKPFIAIERKNLAKIFKTDIF